MHLREDDDDDAVDGCATASSATSTSAAIVMERDIFVLVKQMPTDLRLIL